MPEQRGIDLIARNSLLGAGDLSAQLALLLEGDWPTDCARGERLALDRLIDARWGHLDAAACALVEQLATGSAWPTPASNTRSWPGGEVSVATLADLFALRLRYYLLKLLRLVAVLEGEPCLQTVTCARLIVAARGDEDLVALTNAWAARRQIALRVEWRGAAAPAGRPLPQDRLWRRGLGRVARWLESRLASSSPRSPAVLLCGNPTHLRPVALALRETGTSVVWCYERFAARAWLADGLRQDRQRWCEPLPAAATAAGHDLDFPVPEIAWQGVPLGPAVHAGFLQCASALGRWVRHRSHSIERILEEEAPRVVVLDEDATPFARAVIRAAQRRHVTTFVVQHGAPYVRFGFAPPAADQLLVWGQGTRARLESWGVPSERITVVGCPWWTTTSPEARTSLRKTLPATSASRRSSRPRLLLLATVGPRDDRPDAVSFHLTSASYRGMLRAVAEVVAELPGARLIVRPHPRGRNDATLRAVLNQHLAGCIWWEQGGSLARILQDADCVLSCASSAGVEAAAAGLPVIQLLPEGSEDVCTEPHWGFVGTARTTGELRRLVEQVLTGISPGSNARRPCAFDAWGMDAARRIVDEIEQWSASAPRRDAHPASTASKESCRRPTSPRRLVTERAA